MNKIVGTSNRNDINTLLSKKLFSFKINKLSTTDNTFHGNPCDVLYTGYLNKDISFGDIVYFEPKNIQYKKLVNGVIDQLKVSLQWWIQTGVMGSKKPMKTAHINSI